MRQTVGACALAGIVCACAAQQPASPPVRALADTELRELNSAEKKLLAEHLSRDLKDPGSAQFRWTKFPKIPSDNEPIHYCGTVNAKNSYGGYVGHQPFIAVIGVVKGKIATASIGALASSQPGDAETVERLCKEKGLTSLNAS